MKRYLGLTDGELQENTELWGEETAQPIESDPQGSDLRTVGVSPSDIEGDIEMGDAVSAEAGAEGGGEVDVNVDMAAPAAPAPV